MGKRFTAIAAALAMLSMMLAISAAAAPVGAGEGNELKIVENRDVDITFSFTLEEIASSELVALLPPEMLEDVDPSTEVTVHLDGKLHVNAIARETDMGLDLNAHIVWHGSIGLQIGDWPELAFDFKNAQLKLSGLVPASVEDVDLKVNFHIKGQLSVGGVEEGLDLSTHIVLKIDDGQLTSFKIWLPELVEEYLLDM